ncbi:MAG: hypothetical protein WCJ59_01450 [bacterium]
MLSYKEVCNSDIANKRLNKFLEIETFAVQKFFAFLKVKIHRALDRCAREHQTGGRKNGKQKSADRELPFANY